MDETSNTSDAGGGDGIDPKTPVVLSLPLHEAMALALLYERAPDDLDLHDESGTWFGLSVDLAALRLSEAIAKTLGSKNLLLEAGRVRAMFDQMGVKP